MSEKKDRELRQQVGYKPGRDNSPKKEIHKTFWENGEPRSCTLVCTGLRKEYLTAKRSR